MWMWLSSKDGMIEHLINLDHVSRAEIVTPCDGEETPTEPSLTLYTVDGGKLEIADPEDGVRTITNYLNGEVFHPGELANYVRDRIAESKAR